MKRNQSTALVRRFSSSLRLSLAFGLVGVFASTGSAASPSKDTYYVNDHLATTVATSDAAGEIAQIESDAFGTQTGPVAKDSRFTGKPYDADMGAYVFPFRNYRSDEARWMSADPSGFPDGINGKLYACKPTSEIDPLGLKITFSDPSYGANASYTLSNSQQSVDLSFAGSLKYTWDGVGLGSYSLSFKIDVTGSANPGTDSYSPPSFTDQSQSGLVWTANKSTGTGHYGVGTYKVTITAQSSHPDDSNQSSTYTSAFSFEVKRE